jgi:hypothetical protein
MAMIDSDALKTMKKDSSLEISFARVVKTRWRNATTVAGT